MTTTPTTPVVDQTLGTALSARARPPRAGALSATLTFAWRPCSSSGTSPSS